MSKKKASRGNLHGPAGGLFLQKKKVVIGNVKHSGDEKDISLNKSGSGSNVFSDVDSLFSNDNDANMSGFYGRSLLSSAANTPKAKHVNTGAVFGSSLKSPNFAMDNVEVVLPPRVPIFLNRKWVNPKIVKIPVKVSVKKSFALDINLLAVEGKSAMAKTQVIRKIFSLVNGFGGTTTLSKFEEIIRLTFTSKESMKVATSLAREKGIVINTDFKKQRMHSDQAVVLKEISMDTLKDMIVTAKAVVEFAKSSQADQLASKWSLLIGKDSVHVARAVEDRDVWASRDCYRALLFTLPVGTTAHDLGTLLDKVGEKTCVINHSLKTGNRFCCAIVCFESADDLNSAFLTEPILGGVWLSWASGKSWAQVVSLASFSGSGFGSGVFSLGVSDLGGGLPLLTNDNSFLNACLVSLERSLELLHDQVSGIVRRLGSMNLVSLAPPPSSSGILDVLAATSFDMILDDISHDPMVALLLPLVGLDLGSSSSKVLISKVGSLESKLVALNASVGAILGKLDQLCTSLGFQASSSSQ
ncbi:hypothetical protein G9A89_014371 [Geosiphon pyriformis]|nr:hypothetical protein G9A89_014371 [Geosiphon pyriformis]